MLELRKITPMTLMDDAEAQAATLQLALYLVKKGKKPKAAKNIAMMTMKGLKSSLLTVARSNTDEFVEQWFDDLNNRKNKSLLTKMIYSIKTLEQEQDNDAAIIKNLKNKFTATGVLNILKVNISIKKTNGYDFIKSSTKLRAGLAKFDVNKKQELLSELLYTHNNFNRNGKFDLPDRFFANSVFYKLDRHNSEINNNLRMVTKIVKEGNKNNYTDEAEIRKFDFVTNAYAVVYKALKHDLNKYTNSIKMQMFLIEVQNNNVNNFHDITNSVNNKNMREFVRVVASQTQSSLKQDLELERVVKFNDYKLESEPNVKELETPDFDVLYEAVNGLNKETVKESPYKNTKTANTAKIEKEKQQKVEVRRKRRLGMRLEPSHTKGLRP